MRITKDVINERIKLIATNYNKGLNLEYNSTDALYTLMTKGNFLPIFKGSASEVYSYLGGMLFVLDASAVSMPTVGNMNAESRVIKNNIKTDGSLMQFINNRMHNFKDCEMQILCRRTAVDPCYSNYYRVYNIKVIQTNNTLIHYKVLAGNMTLDNVLVSGYNFQSDLLTIDVATVASSLDKMDSLLLAMAYACDDNYVEICKRRGLTFDVGCILRVTSSIIAYFNLGTAKIGTVKVDIVSTKY